MNLIQKYLALVTDVVSFKEYDKKKSVSDYNHKTTQLREIATEIEKMHPEYKNEFCELLSHSNAGIRLWVAHHILEVMNCDQTYRKIALKEIRNKAKADTTATAYGEKMWLKEWYKTHPNDRWI